MTFYLIRHTETVGNAERRFNGWTESPYTERGIKMNDVLVNTLAAIHEKDPVSKIYASPIDRAKHIGEMLAERTGIPLEIHEPLKEFNFGIFEGLTAEEAEAKDPEMWQRWMADYNHVPLKGGGCYDEYHKALGEWISQLDLSSDERVMVVAHGGTVNSLLLHLLDLPMGVRWHFSVPTGGIALIDAPEGFGILKELYSPNYEGC